MTFERDPTSSYEHWVILEGRTAASGELAIRLRLRHTTSVGAANNYVYSSDRHHLINVQKDELNRDFSPGARGPGGPWIAPYAILLTDLTGDIHHLQDDWHKLGPDDVRLFGPLEERPYFANLWLLADCGPAPDDPSTM